MTARKTVEQAKARELRADGWSVPAIAIELAVSKGSVSLWVRDVSVDPTAIKPDGPRIRPPKPKLLYRYAAALGMEPAVKLRVWNSGKFQRCARCGHTLPVEMFNRMGDGYQARCRNCFREYFRERGDKHRRQSGAAKAVRIAKAKAHIAAHLSAHPCTDCDEPDPVILEFDHVGPKRAGVSWLVANGAHTARLDSEIVNCEVVCVNCHRLRTAQRGNWIRGTLDWKSRLPMRTRFEASKIAYAYEALEASGCVDCGLRSLPTLEFDHRRDKIAGIAVMLHTRATLDEVAREIAKCEVRCGNCHRRRTAVAGGHNGLTHT